MFFDIFLFCLRPSKKVSAVAPMHDALTTESDSAN